MQLGFVSAIFGDLDLESVFAFAAAEKFDCIELMCWPPGGSSRRYAGVTHVDVTQLNDIEIRRIHGLVKKYAVQISGLGYYPNPLDPDLEGRAVVVRHLMQVIDGAAKLGLGIVNTFIGRDPAKSVEANWAIVDEVWPAIMKHADKLGVRIGIENCPMLFSKDEWPGGKNLAVSPAIWRTLFSKFPTLGLNYDPSHLVWQHIDTVKCIREFGKKLVHFHAKDTRIDHEKLFEVGNMAFGWHTPKIPGLGDVPWSALFSALTDIGYRGAVCIEVEDRAFEGGVEDRKRSLRQSKKYLDQFVS